MATLSLTVKSRTGYSRTFVDAAVTTGTDRIALPGHTFSTGDLVRLSNSGGAVPAGLVTTRPYYVIKVDDGVIKLASSSANATSGTAVDITAAAGGGTHTIKLVGAAFKDIINTAAGDSKYFARAVSALFKGFAGGAADGSVDVSEDTDSPVAASGTITITHANLAADDTVTIGGVTITAKASASVDSTQFSIGADAAADATNLAAAINTNLTLSRVMTASADSGVVTLTMKVKGVVGNCIVMSTSDATAYGLAAFSGGTGGASGTVTTYSFGL